MTVTSEIAIFAKADGALVLLAPSGTALREGQAAVNLPAGYSAETFVWSATTKTMIESPAKVQAVLIALVKASGEERRMLALSPGGAKKMVYNAKLAEVEQFRGLFSAVVGGTLAAVLTAVAGLPAADRKRKFRYALTEAARRGEANIAAAIGRFEAGADIAATEAARVEAIEQAAVAAIKAAPTATAKRAAYAAIDWTWAPA